MSGALVRAVLAGHKTQTRRPIRDRWGESQPLPPHRCPFGVPGDRLWVRETWRPFCMRWSHGVEYREDREQGRAFPRQDITSTNECMDLILATGGYFDGVPDVDAKFINHRWRPSIHMPRWASRITLEVERVRVERVQDITGADVLAEGVSQPWDGRGIEAAGGMTQEHETVLRARFRAVWDSIYGEGPCRSEANPWVWVVDFRRVAP